MPCHGLILHFKESYQLSNRFISFRKTSSETGTGQEAYSLKDDNVDNDDDDDVVVTYVGVEWIEVAEESEIF
jgi:hypothetical protein